MSKIKFGSKRLEILMNETTKCKHCGHKQLVARDKVICNWCGYYIYKNDLIEFKEKLQSCFKKEKEEWY